MSNSPYIPTINDFSVTDHGLLDQFTTWLTRLGTKFGYNQASATSVSVPLTPEARLGYKQMAVDLGWNKPASLGMMIEFVGQTYFHSANPTKVFSELFVYDESAHEPEFDLQTVRGTGKYYSAVLAEDTQELVYRSVNDIGQLSNTEEIGLLDAFIHKSLEQMEAGMPSPVQWCKITSLANQITIDLKKDDKKAYGTHLAQLLEALKVTGAPGYEWMNEIKSLISQRDVTSTNEMNRQIKLRQFADETDFETMAMHHIEVMRDVLKQTIQEALGEVSVEGQMSAAQAARFGTALLKRRLLDSSRTIGEITSAEAPLEA